MCKGTVFDEPSFRSGDQKKLSLGAFGSRIPAWESNWSRITKTSDTDHKKKSYSTPTTPVQKIPDYSEAVFQNGRDNDYDYEIQVRRKLSQLEVDEVMSEGDDEGVSWRKTPRIRKQSRRRLKRMSKEKRRQEIKSSSPTRKARKVYLKPRGNTNSNRNSPLPSPREENPSYEW